jgi:hypothetical protein
MGILVRLITGHCPLNKHLHNMGLIDEPICIACGMEDESAFHLLCNCQSLISLRMRLFSKPILSVKEYEGASASALLRFALWQICGPHAEILSRPILIHPSRNPDLFLNNFSLKIIASCEISTQFACI